MIGDIIFVNLGESKMLVEVLKENKSNQLVKTIARTSDSFTRMYSEASSFRLSKKFKHINTKVKKKDLLLYTHLNTNHRFWELVEELL
jgi:hypothetical protein